MRRPVLIQLSLFVITAVVAAIVGVGYVLGPGTQIFGGSLTLTAQMDDAVNLAVGSGVTYRGVAVGSVTDISISETALGADLHLTLDPGTQVPVGSLASVTNNNALGIQTLDIMPTTADGPYLTDGDRLDVPSDLQPRSLDELLLQASTLTESIDPDSVAELSKTMSSALAGTGDALAGLIDDAETLSRMLDAHAPALTNIVETGTPMLDAFAARSDSIPGSASAAREITQQLLAQEPSLIHLVDRSPDALARTSALLDDTRGTVGALMTNMVSVSSVLGDRTPALSALLVALPDTLGELTSIVDGDRGNFTLVGTQGPVCWYDTTRRSVGDESPREPNLNLYCPPGPDLEQRGAQNAPRPNELGRSGASEPGNVTGPPMAEDPLLIPTAVEALDYWTTLLEGVQG